jgi:hypothetical protein
MPRRGAAATFRRHLSPGENECKTCHGKETRRTPAANHEGVRVLPSRYSPKSNEAPLRFDWKIPDINFSHAAHAKKK